MFKNNKNVIVTASNQEGNLLHLRFKVVDTDLADRWMSLIEKNQTLGHVLQNNYRKILSPEDKIENFEIFQNNILKINSMYDRELADIRSLEHLLANQELLNDLHEEFEIYGDRLDALINAGYFNNPDIDTALCNAVWPGRTQNFDVHERFLRLNEQIHNFETIFRNWGSPEESQCSCLVDYIPAGIHENLKPEDFFLFESNLHWGWIYLGYNTLGKHWLSSALENDHAVVARKQVRPQARFAAEFYMYFGRPLLTYSNRTKFYNWWISNNFSENNNPDMSLSEFALGYVPMARIFNYKFDDLAWEAVPIDCTNNDAKAWNSNIWSKFNTIVKVSIVDDENN